MSVNVQNLVTYDIPRTSELVITGQKRQRVAVRSYKSIARVMHIIYAVGSVIEGLLLLRLTLLISGMQGGFAAFIYTLSDPLTEWVRSCLSNPLIGPNMAAIVGTLLTIVLCGLVTFWINLAIWLTFCRPQLKLK
jgi:hypothetical protein